MSEPGPPPPPPEGEAPSPEELAAAFAYQLGRTPVRDVLLQTMATFADMAGIRLGLGPEGEERRDLTQARQAIEVLRTLVDVAEQQLGAAQARPFREPLAALQLAYARAAESVGTGAAGEPGGDPAAEDGAEGAGGQEGAPEAPPAHEVKPDAASRLWVPPGTRRD